MPIELDDICFNKAATIEKCLNRVFQIAKNDSGLEDQDYIDALVLNLERACQAAIDLAMHIVARDRHGMPQKSGEAFELLARAKILQPETARVMSSMVGFRNIAVHAYKDLSMDVVKNIVQKEWRSFVEFAKELGLRVEPKQ